MNNLSKNKCDACNAFTPKLTAEEISELIKQVDGWQLMENRRIFKRWEFDDFIKSLKFVNEIAKIAEEEGHHPNINFSYGFVEVSIWTHAIDGLSKNDFILAAKINEI